MNDFIFLYWDELPEKSVEELQTRLDKLSEEETYLTTESNKAKGYVIDNTHDFTEVL